MATDDRIKAGRPASERGDVLKNLRRMALVVLALALAGGATGMAFEPRLGLFATALILGWTQLVGL
jgi:hypothetical protein